MKHAVLGAGAVGGLMAVGLSAIGEEVSLVVRPEKLAAYPDHLVLEQPTGIVTATAHLITSVSQPFDVVWIATRTFQLKSALGLIEAMPKVIVPLLNGTDHMPVLRTHFGADRVVAGAIAVEAVRTSDGKFEQRNTVILTVGAAAKPSLQDILPRLQERMGFVCRFVEDETTLLWTKLCFLAPFALVTSASGKNKGEIFDDPEWKATLFSAIEEATQVAAAAGADVSAEKVRSGFDKLGAPMRSSMAKDVAAGRPLELEDIAGPILNGGARYGIPVPTVKRLVAIVRDKDSHRASTGQI
jgi:2-dehydropantoate 2-reductase